ncbi:hypothetical protein AOQ84DRAFT_267357, partial [Glonium stellatum]
DPNAQGGKYGNALQAASRWGNIEAVKILLKAGANANAPSQDKYLNALDAALKEKRKEIAELLLQAGADLKTLDLDEETID